MNKFVPVILIIFFISGLFVTVFSSISVGLAEDSWNTKASMHYPRYSLGVVAVDGKIYAIGGYLESFNFLDINECYNPKTDTWTTLKPMPTGRSSFAIAAYEGKIYCIGGVMGTFDGGYAGASVNEVYDIFTDSWSVKASAPFSLGWLSAHVIDGKIFVITAHGELYMYDPFTDVWVDKTNIPSPVAICSASFVIDDTIIVIHTIITPEDQMEPRTNIYNSKTDTWREGNSPKHISDSSATGVTTGVYAPQRVYVLSKQYDPSTTYVSNLVYNPVKDKWSTAKNMPSDRISFGAAVVDDILYVIGGRTSESWECTSLNEQYIPIGYHDTLSSGTKFSLSNTTITAAAFTLAVGIAEGLLFYFQKRKTC